MYNREWETWLLANSLFSETISITETLAKLKCLSFHKTLHINACYMENVATNENGKAEPQMLIFKALCIVNLVNPISFIHTWIYRYY